MNHHESINQDLEAVYAKTQVESPNKEADTVEETQNEADTQMKKCTNCSRGSQSMSQFLKDCKIVMQIFAEPFAMFLVFLNDVNLSLDT